MARSPFVFGCAVFVVGAVVGARPVAADVLTLADGRLVEGTVVKDGDVYRVVSRFGEAEFPAREVRDWAKSPSLEGEWRERSAKLAPDDHAGRAALAAWLVASGRVTEGRAVAEQVLASDPENAVAHEVLGHVRHRGAWMSPDDAKRADGLERHGDRWMTPEEWAALGAEAKAKADEESRAAEGRRVAAELNAAAQLMLAPDPALRAEGKKRLETLARETKTEAIAKAASQLAAYAGAVDAYMDALHRGDTATVLAECRIQLAKLKRPIRTFQTSLSSNLGGAPVSIQLPELEVIKLNTTVPIPAGVK
jgi:hypothetical protein